MPKRILQGVVVSDARRTTLVPRAWVNAFGLEALVLFPLHYRGESVGLMIVEYAKGKDLLHGYARA